MIVRKRNLLINACVLVLLSFSIQASAHPVDSGYRPQVNHRDTEYIQHHAPNSKQNKFLIDQANEVLLLQYSYNIDFLKPLGQEFTPKLHALDAVELFIDDANCSTKGSKGGSLKVIIHEESIDGPVVGSSKVSHFPSCYYNVLRFEFPAFVPLIPGKKYVIEPVYVSGNTSTIYVDKGPSPLYQTGSLIFQGALTTEMDMWFREGLSTFIARKEVQAKQGGWKKLVRADGTPFTSERECIDYINTMKE